MILFQLLGIIILIAFISAIVFNKIKSKGTSEIPPIVKWVISGWRAIAIPILSIFIFLTPWVFFYAEYGYNYYLVTPFGQEYTVMDSRGIKLRMFSRIVPWTKYIDIKTVNVNENGNPSEDVSELEGYIPSGVPIRFIDQVTGVAKFAVRFQMPNDEESFIEIAKKFRSMRNLVDNTLIPTLEEQTKNTGYMFAAQDYISGEAQLFKQTLEEQLKGGGYQVIKSEIRDTIYSDILDQASRQIKEINTTYKVTKVEKGGIPVRIPHEITENNILVSQVIVQDVDPEPKFKERLEKQRDESAKRQLAQQETETAKAEQLKILAQGENLKAQERVDKEKEQISQVIDFETQKAIEQQKLETAKIALETAQIEAKRIKELADAKAYENAKLVQAGLTPQERAKIDKEKAIGVAEQLKELKMPTYMIVGGNSGGKDLNILESLIGIKLMNLDETSK